MEPKKYKKQSKEGPSQKKSTPTGITRATIEHTIGPCQVLRDLVKFDLFWDFDNLLKEEHKTKRRSWDLNPFLGFGNM
jgi:hypothetical protein